MDYDIVAGVGPNKVLVVGAGKTGLAVARFCQQRGAQVTVTDSRTGARAALGARGARRPRDLAARAARAGVVPRGRLDRGLAGRARHQAAAGGAQEGRAHHRRDRARGRLHPGADRRRHRHQRQVDRDRAGRRDRAADAAADLRRRQPRHAAHQRGRHAGGDGQRASWWSSCRASSSRPREKLHPRAAAFSEPHARSPRSLPRASPYGAAKLKLAANLIGDDVAVVNADDEFFWPPPSGCASARACAPSRRGASSTATAAPSTAFVDGGDLVALGERYPIGELQLVGRHNLGNALAAILLMRGNELATYEQVRAALRAFRPLPHRMQLVGERRGLRFYDDSKATNVDSVVAGARRLPDAVRADRRRARQGRLLRAAGARACATTAAARSCSSARRPTRSSGPARRDIRRRPIPVARAATMEEAVSARRRAGAARATPWCCRRPASSYDMFDNYEHRGRVFAAAVEAL